MRVFLKAGDRVSYEKNGKTRHAIVADFLPLKAKGLEEMVAVFKKNEKTATWIPRKDLRKCP